MHAGAHRDLDLQLLAPTTPSSGPARGAGLLDQCRAPGGALPFARGRRANAAILCLYCRALAEGQASRTDLTDPAPSDPAHGSKLNQARTVDSSSSQLSKAQDLIEDGRRREAHGHHRVGARTRGSAPASNVCGGAARDRQDAPPRNRPEPKKRRPTRATWPAARRRRRDGTHA